MLTMADTKPPAEAKHATCRWCGVEITSTKHTDLITTLIDHVDKEHL